MLKLLIFMPKWEWQAPEIRVRLKTLRC